MLIGDTSKPWLSGEYTAPHGLIRVLVPFGLIPVATGIIFVFFRCFKEENSSFVKLIIIWFLCCLASFPIYPPSSGWLMSRYLVPIYLPMTIILSYTLFHLLSDKKYFRISIMYILLIAAHIIYGAHQIYMAKKDKGYDLIINATFQKYVENNIRDSNIVLLGTKNPYFGEDNNIYLLLYEISQTSLDKFSEFVSDKHPAYVVLRSRTPPVESLGRECISIENNFYFRLLGEYDHGKDIFIHKIK
jgi:hypothetical protein